MKYIALIAAIIVVFPVANAMSMEWEPKNPKEGDVVKIYATLGIDESHDVRYEYCVGETFCSIPQPMKYENGKWVANFTVPNAKNLGLKEIKSIEVKIFVDGNITIDKNITLAKEKKTPSFEFVSVIAAGFIAILWRKRWR